jgi:hypothetical protein
MDTLALSFLELSDEDFRIALKGSPMKRAPILALGLRMPWQPCVSTRPGGQDIDVIAASSRDLLALPSA